MADKKAEVLPKNRLEEADVTEISLVKAGAVEDADYVVLQKEAPEETAEEEAVEKTAPSIEEAYASVLELKGSLSKEQVESLREALGELFKEDTMEEEGTEDKVEDSDESEDEAEKECKDEVHKSVDERLSALEGSLKELIEKLAPPTEEAPEEPAAEDVEQTEDTEEEATPQSVFSRTLKILEERRLAKEVSPEAKVAAAVQKLNGKLEEVATGVTDMKRRLARECGQDA